MYWKKDILLNKCYWKNWLFSQRLMTPDTHLLLCTDINLKWIEYLNVIPRTLKVPKENTGEMQCYIGSDRKQKPK